MNKDPWFRNRLIRDAIYKAIHERMSVDASVYIMGEGSGMKIHFDAPRIEAEFGDRVITLPISEDANTNFAVGLSLAGVTPIVDVISSDFLYRTMDAICNTVAKENYVANPKTIIIRSEFLTGGPTSGQRIEALFTHIPGLNVVVPSNPRDAYDLMCMALSTKAATVFFEDRMIEDKNIPEALTHYSGNGFGSLGQARIAKYGDRVTVVSYGLTMHRLERILFENPHCALIDLRTLYPLDVDTVLASVRVTGALLMVEPDVKFMGIGAELVAAVVEREPKCLVKRIGGLRATIPASRDLHEQLFPAEQQVLAAIEALR